MGWDGLGCGKIRSSTKNTLFRFDREVDMGWDGMGCGVILYR